LVAVSAISNSNAPAGRGSKNARPSCDVKSFALWSKRGSANETHAAARAKTRESNAQALSESWDIDTWKPCPMMGLSICARREQRQKGAAAHGRSHDEWHEPEPSDNVLLVGLVVQLDVCHVVEHDEVKHHRCRTRRDKPTPSAALAAERQNTREEQGREQRPLLMQPQNKVVQTLHETPVDAVISSEFERSVLLSQYVSATRHKTNACGTASSAGCAANLLNPASEFESPQLTWGLLRVAKGR
jgi:hypothetical protein